jgi:zinc D-Ala-D-Ala dipeptidase
MKNSMIQAAIWVIFVLSAVQCQNRKTTAPAPPPEKPTEQLAPAAEASIPLSPTSVPTPPTAPPSNPSTPITEPMQQPNTTAVYDTTLKQNWVDIEAFEPSIKLDIRYATANNFTKSQIYDCPKCLLRPEVAQAIANAHKELQKQGLGLKMYDCYRPGPYQQRLWDKVPDENYVAPPSKGSMHSRGVAVDLTIIDAQGNELDMGTTYDFFGPEAHTAYTNLPAKTLANRRLLKKVLEDQGFNAIKYEWWHYNYRLKEYPLSSYVWPCK